MNRKISQWLYVSMIIMLVVMVMLYFNIAKKDMAEANPINTLRVETNPIYTQITQSWPLNLNEIDHINKVFVDSRITYTIVSLDEEIVFTNSKTIDIAKNQLLKTALYMDENYTKANPNLYKLSQPIYDQNTIVGFIIFETSASNTSQNYSKLFILIAIYGLVLLLIIMLGIKVFCRDNHELIVLEKGLKHITKGIYNPINVVENSLYPKVYHSYNLLISELNYIMGKKANDEARQKTFLTMISHELKTPIATINAYVEGLIKGIDKDKEKRDQYLKIIYDKTNQLTNQVEEFFEYTQDNSDRFKFNFEECYADVIIEKIYNDITAQSNGEISYENHLPKCIINVDIMRIEQVIMNLYNNAKKHISDQDRIILKAYRANDEIVLEVADNGSGISAAELPYIFDRYYQGESSAKKDYSGIGLGLSICKSIIDSHNGRMKVKSKEGIGTTMTVIIPIV